MLCVNVVCITGMYDCDRIRLPIAALPGTGTALRPTRSFSRYRDNSILSGTQSRSKTNTTHLTSCSFLLTNPFASTLMRLYEVTMECFYGLNVGAYIYTSDKANIFLLCNSYFCYATLYSNQNWVIVFHRRFSCFRSLVHERMLIGTSQCFTKQ